MLRLLTIGRCHGFTGRPNDPYCYHPGPGVLPVWASDLLAWVVVALVFSVPAFLAWKAAKQYANEKEHGDD